MKILKDLIHPFNLHIIKIPEHKVARVFASIQEHYSFDKICSIINKDKLLSQREKEKMIEYFNQMMFNSKYVGNVDNHAHDLIDCLPLTWRQKVKLEYEFSNYNKRRSV